tara:strand:+ start:296 stop:580 length:285 start_codon:yes stop_codon:yes gene_type:complete
MIPNYIKTHLTNSKEETNWGVSNKETQIKYQKVVLNDFILKSIEDSIINCFMIENTRYLYKPETSEFERIDSELIIKLKEARDFRIKELEMLYN